MELPTIELMIIKSKKTTENWYKINFPPNSVTIHSLKHLKFTMFNTKKCVFPMDFSGHAQEYFPTNRGSLSTISLSPNFTTRLLPRLMVFRDTTGIITASMPGDKKTWQVVVFFPRFPRCCLFKNERGGSFCIWNDPTTFLETWSQSSYCWWLRNPVNQRKDVLKKQWNQLPAV